MFLHSLFHRRVLHVVAEEVAEIGVCLLRQEHGGVLERELLAFAEPFLREYLLVMIRTCIYLYVFCFVEIIEMAQLIHLLDEAAAKNGAEEEACRLDGEATPSFLVGQ